MRHTALRAAAEKIDTGNGRALRAVRFQLQNISAGVPDSEREENFSAKRMEVMD